MNAMDEYIRCRYNQFQSPMPDSRTVFSNPTPSFGPVSSGGLESWRSPGTESGQALRHGSDFQKRKEDERIDVCLM